MFSKNSVILIVEDSNGSRAQLRAELKTLGYVNVLEAENGIRGLQQIEKAEKSAAPVSLVISDLNMPEMDGLEFLKRVRGTEHLVQLPFIVVTTNTEAGEVVKAVNAGASSYLLKPYDIHELHGSLEEVFKRQRLKF